VRVFRANSEGKHDKPEWFYKRGLLSWNFDLFTDIPIVPEVERFGLTAGLLLVFKRKDPQLCA
jgi:hypothetical protein